MKNKHETTTLTLRLPSDLKSELEGLASEESRSLNNFVTLILKQYVKNHQNNKN